MDTPAGQPERAMGPSNDKLTPVEEAGFFLGTGGTYYALRRTGVRQKNLRMALLSLCGGFAGSLCFIPIGIGLSRSSLRSIEDPQHLARVLQQRMEQRRSGVPQDTAPQDMGSAQPFEQRERPVFDSPSAADADWTTTNMTPPSSTRAAGDTDHPPGTGIGTRWDELRQNRVGSSSVWEQIRQENGKRAMQGAARGPETATSRVDSSAPSTGSQGASQSDYERAKREYEAAFAREQAGMDRTGGLDEGRWR
ncbi:hypothetical protein MSPP1_001355 [Malassezia sp. CBS 17886]|nr:hypothetical protein MSPP1_001355 [Malassezia sp. CBS 17886]